MAFLRPERLTCARELRGLTKKALAGMIGKSPAAITQFESGLKPDIDTLISISKALEVPMSFFSVEQTIPSPAVEEFHFRARASVTQMMKYRSRRYAERVVDIFRFLEEYGVEFTSENVTPVQATFKDGMPIPDAANHVRSEWGLQNRPIHNLFALFEQNGIFIILLDQEYKDLEACATWFGSRPCIMLAYNNIVSASRIQFDLAHELGHLFLHDESFVETVKEPQAHVFASSFLMPAESYLLDSPRKWHLGMFLEIKRKWHVSLQAALWRSRDLNVISDSNYRWGMVDLSKKGYRLNEPGEFSLEEPSLLRQAVELVKDRLSLEDIARAVHILPGELEDVLRMQRVPEVTIKSLKKHEPVNKGKIVTFTPRD